MALPIASALIIVAPSDGEGCNAPQRNMKSCPRYLQRDLLGSLPIWDHRTVSGGASGGLGVGGGSLQSLKPTACPEDGYYPVQVWKVQHRETQVLRQARYRDLDAKRRVSLGF